jgi:hypothetical protein
MTTSNGTGWRNRIVRYGEAAPGELVPNPRNWRRHPRGQTDALAGVLAEVGWATGVIVNARTGHLVDGHARVELALARKEPAVPVVYVDLSPEEEAKVLATFDPLGAMAAADRDALERLLAEVTTDDAALRQTLRDLGERTGVWSPGDGAWADAFGGLPAGDRAPFRQMTFTLSDGQAELVERALREAKGGEAVDDTGNENSNGNALARIAETYLGG